VADLIRFSNPFTYVTKRNLGNCSVDPSSACRLPTTSIRPQKLHDLSALLTAAYELLREALPQNETLQSRQTSKNGTVLDDKDAAPTSISRLSQPLAHTRFLLSSCDSQMNQPGSAADLPVYGTQLITFSFSFSATPIHPSALSGIITAQNQRHPIERRVSIHSLL
jgi:hypothetical protein